ncbi:unnamed protein product [Thlaspi arvense]|uniref:Replication protein A 70 kDa DNA-binding subunit B/D first OB fold domain-containing protein n=1 Tax=Thlaspi arvense TaxID=13288 RepID=A0AAU9RWZ4_THLAR|nr:unnamed protein product [Thlaspi arvense]
MNKQHLKRYENHLSVGSWKFIEEFNVSNSIGQYRTTKHCYRISFVKYTIVSNFADQIVEATSNNETEKLICLIRFGKIKEFRELLNGSFDEGMLTLTNTESIVDDEIPNQVTPTSKRKVEPIIEVLEDQHSTIKKQCKLQMHLFDIIENPNR